jgi:hypothetical protein
MSTQQVQENRRKAVKALRSADESRRLTGAAREPVTGKACACTVIAERLGLPMLDPEYPKRFGIFNYPGIEAALGISGANEIWVLNDQRHEVDDEPGDVVYTFAEIGDILEQRWAQETALSREV